MRRRSDGGAAGNSRSGDGAVGDARAGGGGARLQATAADEGRQRAARQATKPAERKRRRRRRWYASAEPEDGSSMEAPGTTRRRPAAASDGDAETGEGRGDTMASTARSREERRRRASFGIRAHQRLAKAMASTAAGGLQRGHGDRAAALCRSGGGTRGSGLGLGLLGRRLYVWGDLAADSAAAEFLKRIKN
ncbi:hypothetical protein E2562_010149 [Oryza meyeriana var. granulata]|uniref:Uncharacterized protein n=1 Tax=Oryza meyeriana var. granulata TaxID=110450 RepID=A0A6G1EJB7_9ORYZ|nr:hypothetical protein E2562_010149 [Oryza meyeriana var. granulata]